MNVAAVQFRARKGARDRSLSALRVLAEEAAEGADLVVLPEMAATGYLFPTAEAARAVAEDAEGPTFQALSPVAAAHRCWLVVGFPERAGDRLFNSALVIDPSGALAFTYRKTLLYEADTAWAAIGDSGYRRFDTEAGPFTVGICMDLNDERFLTWCADADVGAIALPTCWLEEGIAVWPYWAWRAHRARAVLIAANTWGTEQTTSFCGTSAIIHGPAVLAGAPPSGDRVIRAQIRG